MTQDKIAVVGTNIAEKAAMIWNVADMLRGPFKPHEYGLVILPMTVVKRFHDCLLPTWQAVQDTYEKVKDMPIQQMKEISLTRASGYRFYNISKFTFDKLLADPQNIEANFRDYLAGFSDNVQDVLAKFEFDNVIKRMVDSNTLYLTIKEFNSPKGYLAPDKISAVDCGYIFEELIRRFKESYGEEAGEHFTSRDIVYLMTDLLLYGANLNSGSVTVYDMTMGTSQMLSCMEERLRDLNLDIDVICFGQEFNKETFAIAKADMLIRGGDPNNMRFGDTLSDDKFSSYHFDFCISNPPFGNDWKKEQKAVEAEHKRGELGRFAPGLPKISDGQQLFVLNGLSKLNTSGKMAIIQNGSPLFAGDAGSGSSEIRRYILENDWLDAIVQLSTDQFMNTGISTYIWICSKDKPVHRAGKVQLIDASHCYEPRRKSIGTKRNDITDHCRKLIVEAYADFKHDTIYGDKSGVYCHSKIFNSEDFGYYKIVVERPQLDEYGKPILKRGKPVADSTRRDFENVPMTDDIEEYFRREVLPYAPDAWIDHKKTKVGYEIPMTRYFYEYTPPEHVEDILARLTDLEADISDGYANVFSQEGLNMSQPMKDSGVEWIGDIPADWKVGRVSYFFDIQLGKMLQPEANNANDTLENYLCAVNLGGNKLKLDTLRQMWFSPSDKKKFDVRKGDLLVVEGGDVASCDIVNEDIQDVYIQNALHRVRSSAGFDVRLLRYLLIVAKAQGYIDLICNKATISHFTKEKFSAIPYPIPPLDEQQRIATFLDDKCANIDSTIEKMKQLISELESLKKSMIFEYVTGKKEVNQ